MFKFLQKLLGTAKMSQNYRAEIEAEGIVLIDEGIRGSVTYTKFRRPGKYAGWQKSFILGHLALSNKRLLAIGWYTPVINVPLSDERLHRMSFAFEGEDILYVRFDANLFQPTWSGTIEYRFHTPQAQAYLDKLRSL
jgi:hypothetical protein